MEEKYGEAISIASSEEEKEVILDKYIKGKPENITSKLAVEPVLRSSILGLIATGFISNQEKLIEFFDSTFYGFQYSDVKSLHNNLVKILDKLEKYEFILREGENFEATLLGKRIAELYVDPESARVLIKGLSKGSANVNSFALLHLVSDTIEMEPLRVKGSEWDKINQILAKKEGELLISKPNEWDPEYEFFISSIKTASILEEWINEKSEDYILKSYNIRPGGLYVKLRNTDWLLYACQEICRILKLKTLQAPIRKTRLRVKYGIKESLIPLVKLKNVGRVRSRKLFSLGIRSLGDLKKIEVNRLSRVLGKKIAISLKEQVGIKVDSSKVSNKVKKGQQSLGSF